MREHDRLYIGGEWTEPASAAAIEVVSPHSGEAVGRVPEGTAADMDRAGAAAGRACGEGPGAGPAPAGRAAVLARRAEGYRRRSAELAELITAEMGCPISFSRLAQVPIPERTLDYYAGLAEGFT